MSRSRFPYGLYNYTQYPVILIITFLMIRYSSGYSTHPGVHVALATGVIDVLTLRIARRWNLINIGCVAVLNVFGAYIILHGSDPLELKVAGWYDLCALLLGLTNIYNWHPGAKSRHPDYDENKQPPV